MRTLWIIGLLTVVGMGASPAAAGGQSIELSTPYLQHKIAGARQVSLRGELGGDGTAALDPNTCALNPFGDRTVCTRIAVQSIAVQFKQVKLADPKLLGRRLFIISGMPRPEGQVFPKYFLVTPGTSEASYRLIVETAKDNRRVIALDAKPAAPGIEKQPEPLCRNVTYRAEQRGTSVRIVAAGRHSSAGWKAYFEPLRIRIFPPQFKLICTPPNGPAAQIVVPFEVSRSFEAGTKVKKVIVHDADGKHEIAVTPVK